MGASVGTWLIACFHDSVGGDPVIFWYFFYPLYRPGSGIVRRTASIYISNRTRVYVTVV